MTDRGDFRFGGAHGYVNDDATGWQQLGARLYVPGIGRFLTQDPLGQEGGLNLYAYCDNSPLNKVDPKGTQMVPIAPRLDGHGHLYSLTAIVREAEARRDSRNRPAPMYAPIPEAGIVPDELSETAQLGMDLLWFKGQVQKGGSWDFKQQGDPKYSAFGNFAYGVSGMALGISPVTLLRQAGLAQLRDHPGMRYSNPRGPYYGDDPADQFWIRQGVEYYRKHYAK